MRFLQRFKFTSAIISPDRTTVLRLRKTVLGLMLLLVALTPLLQLNSLDNFPVTTDDLETQAIYCLLTIGMLLVFALLLRLAPVLLPWKGSIPPIAGMLLVSSAEGMAVEAESPPLPAPLRI